MKGREIRRNSMIKKHGRHKGIVMFSVFVVFYKVDSKQTKNKKRLLRVNWKDGEKTKEGNEVG